MTEAKGFPENTVTFDLLFDPWERSTPFLVSGGRKTNRDESSRVQVTHRGRRGWETRTSRPPDHRTTYVPVRSGFRADYPEGMHVRPPGRSVDSFSVVETTGYYRVTGTSVRGWLPFPIGMSWKTRNTVVFSGDIRVTLSRTSLGVFQRRGPLFRSRGRGEDRSVTYRTPWEGQRERGTRGGPPIRPRATPTPPGVCLWDGVSDQTREEVMKGKPRVRQGSWGLGSRSGWKDGVEGRLFGS